MMYINRVNWTRTLLGTERVRQRPRWLYFVIFFFYVMVRFHYMVIKQEGKQQHNQKNSEYINILSQCCH